MRKELLVTLILISLLLSFVPLHAATRARAAAAARQDDSQKPSKIEFVPGNVLVRFRPGSALAAGARAPRTLRSTGGRQIPAEADEAEGLEIVEGLRAPRVG